MKHWIRTADHLAADGRQPQPGETAWNLAFTDDKGREWVIHVGPKTRIEFIDALQLDRALIWPEKL